jgi:hypothetical protein
LTKGDARIRVIDNDKFPEGSGGNFPPAGADNSRIRTDQPPLLVYGIGRTARRSLNIAFFTAPWVSVAYMIGLPYGAEGVAFAFSAAMILFLVPCLLWCIHRTMISPRELFKTISLPFLSAFIAGIVTFVVYAFIAPELKAIFMLVLGGGIMLSIYFGMLFLVAGQLGFYHDLIKTLIGRDSTPKVRKVLVSIADRGNPAMIFLYRLEPREMVQSMGVNVFCFPPGQSLIPTMGCHSL